MSVFNRIRNAGWMYLLYIGRFPPAVSPSVRASMDLNFDLRARTGDFLQGGGDPRQAFFTSSPPDECFKSVVKHGNSKCISRGEIV